MCPVGDRFDRDRVVEMMLAAYTEGYRHGYGNGFHDGGGYTGAAIEEFDDTESGDGFDEWLQGSAGPHQPTPPFPDLTGQGPLFETVKAVEP
jgi:hypothetical protein